MKIRDILPPQQLDEISLKQAVAAGLIGATAMTPRTTDGEVMQRPPHVQQAKKPTPIKKAPPPVDPVAARKARQKQEVQQLTDIVANRFGIDTDFAQRVVQTAHKYEHPDFPTAEDILAVIGVESHFKPHAVSALQHDPAVGLMQIRPGIWNLPAKELKGVETNIKHGANILRQYYTQLDNDEDAAIQAYNIGITAFKRGKKNPRYLSKVNTERAQYEYPDDL